VVIKGVIMASLATHPLITTGFSIAAITASGRVDVARDNELLWIVEGSGTVQIAGNHFAVKPGTLLLMGKGQSWQTAQPSDLQAIHLVFGDCFWDKTPASARNCKATLYGHIEAHQHFTPAGAEAENIDRLLKDMLLEFQRPDYSNKADVLAAYLKILIIKIANIDNSLSADTNNHHYKIYQQFIDLLQDDAHHTHHVQVFAEQLHISTRKLMDICQLYGHKTPKMMISEQLTATAKRLLQFSTMPVKAIAFQLNFSTPYQFSNFFKKQTTMAPLEFRNRFVQIGM
jgi:AraC family transcriptional regulator, transcriptional activator of pobA